MLAEMYFYWVASPVNCWFPTNVTNMIMWQKICLESDTLPLNFNFVPLQILNNLRIGPLNVKIGVYGHVWICKTKAGQDHGGLYNDICAPFPRTLPEYWPHQLSPQFAQTCSWTKQIQYTSQKWIVCH